VAPTKVPQVIAWLMDCPVVGEHQRSMAALMTRLQPVFERYRLQFTVSMYTCVNSIADDGFHGMRMKPSERWLGLQPCRGNYELIVGGAKGVLGKTIASEREMGALLENALNWLTEPAHPNP
jgi:hypothetical protein